jgi:hypothetical protein
MLRLYFLVPDADTTVKITHELADLGLKKKEVHVVGEDEAQMQDMGVNRATVMQTSDVMNATKRGLIWGIPLGVILGIVAASVLPIAGGWLGVAALLVGAGLFGGFFGIWASTLIGVSVQDVKVTKFQQDIERGAFLMLVDVPAKREHEIVSAVTRHFPEVEIDKVSAEDKHKVGGQGA